MTQTDLDVGPIDYLVVEFPVMAALDAIETETSTHRDAD